MAEKRKKNAQENLGLKAVLEQSNKAKKTKAIPIDQQLQKP